MRAPGEIWYWPGTDEVILILAMRLEKGLDEDGDYYERHVFDEFNLETGQVWLDTPHSIEDDDRWEKLF
jgi:hypothetical protein